MTKRARFRAELLGFCFLLLLVREAIAAAGSDPCQDYTLHDCDKVAECFSEQPGYFQCKCPDGFVDVSPDPRKFPGRKCQKAENECALGTHQCNPNADCIDTANGYSCRCRSGWLDVSPDPLRAPGRQCQKGNQCASTDCAPEAECTESPSGALCRCRTGFVDVSRTHGRPLGRVCRPVVNECAERRHDCAREAECIDTAEAFICRCPDGYLDKSPNPDRPGRICVRSGNVPKAPECNVNDPVSCDKRKQEVCLFSDGQYRCTCPSGFSRLPDGRCLVINECRDPRLNECSKDADCIDQAEGYTCQCRSGFADVSPNGLTGRICQRRLNECSNPRQYGVDCDINAVCMDTEEGYTCRCRPGYADVSESFNRLPGRKCVEAVNECHDKNQNDCSENAICEDAKEGYVCKCLAGFVDASPEIAKYPGRVCNKPYTPPKGEGKLEYDEDSCDPNNPRCGPNTICTDKQHRGDFTCECGPNAFRFYDGSCRQGAACDQTNECDKNAICSNAFDSYKCQCRPGFIDISPDPENRPGRVCRELLNECATKSHDCSPFSHCVDQTEGYACMCIDGFVDTSSQFGLLPGRKCSNVSNECADRSLHTCDENADCVDTPDSYTCQCFTGYVDVSSSANLPPGRVCTVQTSCPKQKTDLMFLIDGSGSIGSYVFKNEVLRFVRQFVELFDIGQDKTRVGLIQYSDQIRHEFDLSQYDDKQSLEQAVDLTQYLTGLTRTGAAIQHMVQEGFSSRRGARPISNDVRRVAIVITDGRSQDNVTEPASMARSQKIGIFAIGVTDHVLASELETIAGSPRRWFYVDRFKDLDMRLRSIIQKEACPSPPAPPPRPGACDPDSQTGCKRENNEICEIINGKPVCRCPAGFDRHPITNECGGALCNPQVATSCPHPEVCKATPFGNYRCACPSNFGRDPRTGICITPPPPPGEPPSCHTGGTRCADGEECKLDANGRYVCSCQVGLERNPITGKCSIPGSCDPNAPEPCDVRKREYCLKHPSGRYYTCQCKAGEKRQPVTDVCLKNECLSGEDDCDVNAICTDTDDSYICNCRSGFLDQSPDPVNKPGRVCSDLSRDCERNSRCSPNAICTNTPDGQVCRCGPGFVDVSPNPQNEPGIICKPEVNECARPDLNNCHRDALCIDTTDSYKCICKAGYKDLDELRNPGRQCQKIKVLIDECKENRHTCSPNADCRDLEEGYTCECKDGYVDHSPNLLTEPGRVCDTPEVCPPNHDCSSAAICKPLGGNKYTCTCIQGYLDQSPAGKQGTVCVRNDRCKDPKLNNCSRNAICYNEPNGEYRCECLRGYEDRSPQGGPKGRVCEPPKPPPPKPRHPCQDPNLNDCHASGACRATGPETYTCECLPGYVDRSPDVKNKPGRVCVISEPICLDSSRNDCHPAAICSETQNEDGYTCRCRDGYIDQSPGKDRRPGRICVEQVNECLDRSLNDCDPIAVCEDQPEGYTCRCPVNAIDQSPDKKRPGRKCFLKVDECANPSLNNCSRFADCVDKEDGYECKCRNGYHDENPAQPGTVCNYIINECESPNLNDCHRNAECIDTPGGYECKCKNPYHDEGPKDRPGRICRYNECADPKAHKCDANADCVDTEDGYVCSCREGFYDNSPDPTIPGQVCIEFQEEPKVTPPAEASEKLIPCGHVKCDPKRNETCIGGRRCGCRPGEGRASPQDACEPIEKTPLAFRVVSRGQQPLLYSSQYGNSDSPDYAEITNEFDKDLGSAVGSTVYAPRYVATDVSYITHPKTINSSWPDGLLVNFTVGTRPSTTPIDVCDLWDKLMESIQQTNGAIGGGQLHVASDIDLLDPCAKPVPTGELCGGQYCNAELGEVCIAGTVCGCVNGEKRASPKDHCRPVEPVNFPLWVIRKNHNQLTYNDTFANPQDAINKQYVDDFNNGIADSYPQTTLKNGFVTSDVIDITDPKLVNATWDKGVIFNATMYFRRGTIRSPQETYQVLVDYIIHRNNLEIGHSGLFLNPYQPNPFSSCYGNTCHAAGKCIELGPNAYRCECGFGYRDKNTIDPGRTCIRIDGTNECEHDEDNDCSENARCIDLPHLYKCECNNGYKDASPKDELPGSVCVLDYCSDVNFCPANTTCVNHELQAVCVCLPGMIDIRKSNMKAQSGIDQSTLCLSVTDVNECALGLTNCSSEAICEDLKIGYKCSCPAGWTDGNLAEPGRICAAPLCGECNQHGHCIYKSGSNVTCACEDGYTGEHCEIAPSILPLILMLLLALLFLLLMLCCLLYLCTKCHCFKRRGDFNTLDQSFSSDEFSAPSDLYKQNIIIPRAKNYLDDSLRIPRPHIHDGSSIGSGASEYTIAEEIERRVITDVMITETVTTGADVHDASAVSSSAVASYRTYGGGESGVHASSSQHMSMRDRSLTEEQERGESVAEFSNGGHAREWRSGSGGYSRHNAAYSAEDDRSVDSYETDNEGLFDKTVLVNHSHDVDPARRSERHRSEVTTTKLSSETYHK